MFVYDLDWGLCTHDGTHLHSQKNISQETEIPDITMDSATTTCSRRDCKNLKIQQTSVSNKRLHSYIALANKNQVDNFFLALC